MNNKTRMQLEPLSELKILVGRDRKSRFPRVIPVPQKGRDEEDYTIKQMLKLMSFLGYPGVILKSDQESALDAVIEAVKGYRGSGQTMDEQSPVQSSQSNGEAERTVQSVESQIRKLVSALEERIGGTLNPEGCVIPWLAIHAGNLLAIFDVRDNGKTPYEKLRGKKVKNTS